MKHLLKAVGEQTDNLIKKTFNVHSKHVCFEQIQHLRPLSDLFEKVNKQLTVNKQLAICKILNFHSKHVCFEQIQRLRPLSGLFQKSKQIAESKQRANHVKNSKFSF